MGGDGSREQQDGQGGHGVAGEVRVHEVHVH